MGDSDDQRTVWCGNLSENVTEEILYELFLQAAPLDRVSIPKDKDGRQCTYGFVTFKHSVSVLYAIDLFNGIELCERRLNIKPRGSNLQRQNSYHRDHSPIYAPPSMPPQNNLVNSFRDLDVLMQMGDQMLGAIKVGGRNDYNKNHPPALHSSTPYRRWDQGSSRDDRRDENRSGYRRSDSHRNSNRHHSNNYKSSHGNKRRDY